MERKHGRRQRKKKKLCLFLKGKYLEEHKVLKTRTNRKLEELNKGENIAKWIKGQRISWLGHLKRMEDRMPKNIFTQELEGTRRRRRPMKGWREEVERDLQVLGVRRWR
jgi:hemolysin-activating ACP:hemolysin acyltransferase